MGLRGYSRRIEGCVRTTVMTVLLLSACARTVDFDSPTDSPPETLRTDQAVGTPASVTARRFSRGEVLYIRNCADCHGWEAVGNGPMAQLLDAQPPTLRDPRLFAANSEAELVARILLGKELTVPLAPVVTPESEVEVTALLGHLQRLPTIAWNQVNAGQEIYDSLCVSCHGIYGRGDGILAQALPAPPRDLNTPPYQSQVSDEELLRIISNGQGAMPGAGDVLGTDEVRAVIAFVRVLSPGYELYDRFCAVCHGPEGRPSQANPRDVFGFNLVLPEVPTFDQTYFATHSEEHVRTWIRHMRKENRAAMPHFAGALTAEEVREILRYLRTLLPKE